MFKLNLTDEDGTVIDAWTIRTEYGPEIEDLDAEDEFDFYVVPKEVKKIRTLGVGRNIGPTIVDRIMILLKTKLKKEKEDGRTEEEDVSG